MISSQNSRQRDKERRYAFARSRALTLLVENQPEQRLDLQLPYEQYLKLEKSRSKERAKGKHLG
ncbi:hypothetical protein V1525DRAFT_408040 [Lipomyces kononenkoae]|uniref:Uncharacterized protein n=1 Tax=Lipomyces kononenkoae TaxID=34357 RepID=A0ACC3SXJ8_LIPKO